MWDAQSMDLQQLQQNQQNQQQEVEQQMLGQGLPRLDEGAGGVSGGYLSDMQTSAWFMPFNMMPPGVADMEEFVGGSGGLG